LIVPVVKTRSWLSAAALVAAVFLAYQPAWRGGPIWDDDMHLTRPELRSWQGLGRIWCDVRATPQYYPFVHSVFWVEHRLWRDAPLGYHLANLLLHATAALLVARILSRLAIPGAWLSAAVFALHPVQVESVAWITELKNTLSAVFYLSAALLYLRFDQTRKTGSYLAALGLFMLALASKTVTATLPGALLVIFWWQRGRLSWKREVLPLAPFFLLGAGMGLTTAWWELEVNQCVGPEFEFTAAERILIAGRGAWFHLGALFWPANLTFIYPRWQIDAHAWRQYLFPLAAAGLLALLWAVRRQSRGPLAAVLFFGGTLLPTMGFFNLYTFRYAFIADHYQYLACLGFITLFSAGVASLLKPLTGWGRRFGEMGCVGLLTLLAVLSWLQSGIYANAETLYRATIARNAACWLAYNNLGLVLAASGRLDEAIVQYGNALAIRPNDAEAHNNLGNALLRKSKVDEAIAQFRQALELKPDFAAVHNNLGEALLRQGHVEEALASFETYLDAKPNDAKAHNDLGIALLRHGNVGEAIGQYRRALEIEPDFAAAHINLGEALRRQGDFKGAIACYRKYLELQPDNAVACNNLGLLLARQGRFAEAIAAFQKALEIRPDYAEARRNLAVARSRHQ
jgi:Tfp pilus assembly protein PilF